jgi:hypothetical protein
MNTTLETSEDENYTRNEWRWILHSKRVKMKNTLETSEEVQVSEILGLTNLMSGTSRHWSVQPCSAFKGNYTRNEWRWKPHSKRVKMQTTLETSEDENYTQNEWRWKLHSKRVKTKPTPKTSLTWTGDGLVDGLNWLVGDVAKRIFVME